MKTNIVIIAGLAMNVLSLGAIVTVKVSSDVTSQNQITARREGLVRIVQHVKADTCWVNKQDVPFKINDTVSTAGTVSGRIPTGCVKAPKTKQYLLVAYKDSLLKVQQVYSYTEVQNQKTIKG